MQSQRFGINGMLFALTLSLSANWRSMHHGAYQILVEVLVADGQSQ